MFDYTSIINLTAVNMTETENILRDWAEPYAIFGDTLITRDGEAWDFDDNGAMIREMYPAPLFLMRQAGFEG